MPSPAFDPATADRNTVSPSVRWSQITEAPLLGLRMAREAGWILAWDDAHNIYLLDLTGNLILRTRPPKPIRHAVISDDGSQIVVTDKQGDIWWLGKDLKPTDQQCGPRNMIGLAISPQGQFLAASSSNGHTNIYDWHGRPVTDLVTTRPLKHMAFLVGRPYLVGAAEYGLAGCYALNGRPRWQDALWSSAGGLSASGEGFALLVSCYGHGLQRYGLDGTNEGAYHLGAGVARASVDYDGKLIAAATLDGELLVVNTAGQVLWRDKLTTPANEVWLDAAGRSLLYGQETGEVTMLDLYPPTTKHAS